MKLKKKNLRFVEEIGFIIFSVFIMVLSYLCDICVFKIPELFILNVEHVEELLFTLFGVQATIASIGIAIVALLSGSNTDSVYGICISRFISYMKPRILKHDRLIIVNLIITVINYFIVSYGLFNVSIALFVISILVSIKLVRDTYIVFLGRSAIREDVKVYILENYTLALVEDIGAALNDPENLKNLSRTKENIEIVENIFEKETIKIASIKSTEIFDRLRSLVIEYSTGILKEKEPRLIMAIHQHVLSLYKIANEKNLKKSLGIWDEIMPEFFESLRELSEVQILDLGLFYEFRNLLYYQKFLPEEEESNYQNSKNLKYYSIWLYEALKNNKESSVDLKRVTRRIYTGINVLYKHDEKIQGEQKSMLMRELCEFSKRLIDLGEYKSIQELLFEVTAYGKETNEELVLTVVIFYLYYLVCREPLVKNDVKQKYAEQILQDNKRIVLDYFDSVSMTKVAREYLPFIREQLIWWEVMPEKAAKTMILDYVITDFFVFSMLETCWEEEDLLEVLNHISPKSSFSIYSSYFSREGKVASLYSQFRKILINKEEEVTEEIDLLRSVLYKKYKLEEIAAGIEEQITVEDELQFAESIKTGYAKLQGKKTSFLFSKSSRPKECVSKKLCISSWTLSNFTINDNKMHPMLEEEIRDSVVHVFLYLMQSYIKVEDAKSDEHNVQEKLIQLAKTNQITGDLYLGNRDVFWKEDTRDLLTKFVVDMKKVNHGDGYRKLYILDTSSYYFSISDIDVEFEDLTDEEIYNSCIQDEDGRMMYNVTNDIYIPFEKDELIEHIHRINKRIKIFANIHFKAKSDLIGVGIHIDLDND